MYFKFANSKGFVSDRLLNRQAKETVNLKQFWIGFVSGHWTTDRQGPSDRNGYPASSGGDWQTEKRPGRAEEVIGHQGGSGTIWGAAREVGQGVERRVLGCNYRQWRSYRPPAPCHPASSHKSHSVSHAARREATFQVWGEFSTLDCEFVKNFSARF